MKDAPSLFFYQIVTTILASIAVASDHWTAGSILWFTAMLIRIRRDDTP